MWELRFVSVSDDGEQIVVTSPDLDGESFLLPITDELRDAINPPARPARPVATSGDTPLTPREIQQRIRSGESPEELATASGVALARIERFAGPVLSERAHVADEARAARISWQGIGDEPSGSLDSVVSAWLARRGVEPDSIEWDAWRRDESVWVVQVGYDVDGERHTAEWSWDPGRRQLRPYGAAARAVSTPPPTEPEPATSAPTSGLRMVATPPPSPAASEPQPEPEPEAEPIDAMFPMPEPAAAAPAHHANGKRPVVPSWDDIVLGVRRKR